VGVTEFGRGDSEGGARRVKTEEAYGSRVC
jgi:hypothetical protein